MGHKSGNVYLAAVKGFSPGDPSLRYKVIANKSPYHDLCLCASASLLKIGMYIHLMSRFASFLTRIMQ